MIRQFTASFENPIEMETVTDPNEITRANAQRKQFNRNWLWLRDHVAEIHGQHRGRCICIAGEELFVADTPEEAAGLVEAAHPDDKGRFLRYIPKEKSPRIFANQRRVVSVR